MTRTWIVQGPLPALLTEQAPNEAGAELVFHGLVRGLEDGTPIHALHYEHYEGMAEAELERVARDTIARFAIEDLRCWHCVGEVPVGQAALRIIVWSKHRVEALDAMTWFIAQLKERVPIYKWAVDAEGQRRPCGKPETPRESP